MWSHTKWHDHQRHGMFELFTLDTPGLATISLKISLSLRCYLCALRRMDGVTDYRAELG